MTKPFVVVSLNEDSSDPSSFSRAIPTALNHLDLLGNNWLHAPIWSDKDDSELLDSGKEVKNLLENVATEIDFVIFGSDDMESERLEFVDLIETAIESFESLHDRERHREGES